MSIQQILSEIDAELARLTRAKELLTEVPAKRGPGRPAGNSLSTTATKQRRAKRMSAEGRARIAAAQKARWAQLRGASAKNKKLSAEKALAK